MYQNFIEKLTFSLHNPLPGESAQMKMAPEGRHRLPINPVSQEAAVLILIFPRKDNPNIVFIKRNEYNGPHSGQISFPGGKFETSDLCFENTAKRETEEETGIDASKIELIGRLSALNIPVSGFTVYPFVGYTQEKPVWNHNPAEVQYLLEVPIDSITDPKAVQNEKRMVQNCPVNIPYFSLNNEKIWGATAMILAEFIALL